MFTNPFNRKYQTGGSVSDKEKWIKKFINWLKTTKKEFKDKSVNEIAKTILNMTKTEEGSKSIEKWKEEFKNSENPENNTSNQSLFAKKGGKMQQFICKHGRGGNVDCGCGGMVIRGEDGIDDVPTPKDSTVTNNGYVIYKPSVREVAPNGESVVITYGHDPNGQWARRMEWANGGTSILGGYNNNGQWVSEGDVTYEPTSEFAKAFLSPKARMSRYEDRPQSRQEGGELTRKQARILSRHNKGFNRGQFQLAMANADAALRQAKPGIHGRELRQAKRRIVAGITPMERTVTMESSPAELNISYPTAETISNLNPNLELPVRETTPIQNTNRSTRRTNTNVAKTTTPQTTSESNTVTVSDPDFSWVGTNTYEDSNGARYNYGDMYKDVYGHWVQSVHEGIPFMVTPKGGVLGGEKAAEELANYKSTSTYTSTPRRNYSAITGQPLRNGQSSWELFKQGGKINK